MPLRYLSILNSSTSKNTGRDIAFYNLTREILSLGLNVGEKYYLIKYVVDF